MSETQASFEGWAIVEMFGHNKAAGFVTTQNFGQACLFRVDTPELPERDFEMKRPGYASISENGQEWVPAGTKVRRPVEPARSKLIGPGAVYAMNPCTEEIVREFLESARVLPLIVLEKPQLPAIAGPDDECGCYGRVAESCDCGGSCDCHPRYNADGADDEVAF